MKNALLIILTFFNIALFSQTMASPDNKQGSTIKPEENSTSIMKDYNKSLASEIFKIEDYNKYLFKMDLSLFIKNKGLEVLLPSLRTSPFFKYQKDSVLFDLESEIYKEGVSLDSSTNYLVAYSNLLGDDYHNSKVLELNDYIILRSRHEKQSIWTREISRAIVAEDFGEGGEEIKIDIPFKIKSKSFHRVFGGNRIGLRVKGNVSLSIIASQTNNNDEFKSTDFQLDQTQNITVKGKVGKKVTIDIAQDTEKLDFENTLKLTYTGYSDEIIQSIEAGNISMSMPTSSSLATFSGKHSGLFGIKTDLKIGNLTSTFVASLEKGEKKKMEFKGGVQTRKQTISAENFKGLTYFFVDKSFRLNYEDNFERLKDMSTSLKKPEYTIDKYSFRLFITKTANNNQKADFFLDATKADSVMIGGHLNLYNENLFIEEVAKDKYTLYDEMGYITLDNMTLGNGQKLAATYKKINSQGNVIEVGSADPSTNFKLQMIAEAGQRDNSYNFTHNEWKNVYNIGATEISSEDFSLVIKKENSDKIEYEGRNFLEWYDIAKTDNPEQVSKYYLRAKKGEFIFPNLKPFNPSTTTLPKTTLGTLPSEQRAQLLDSTMYQNQNNYKSDFELIFKYTSSNSDTKNLGFNIIEGSEVVKSGAKTLIRDVDYIIDYSSGQLTILNEAYFTADLEVMYESSSIFQLDQKVLLGNTWKYSFSEKTYLSASAMYFSETTKDNRVHVGYEPVENFVWDVGGKYNLELPFLTKAIDYLPLLETDTESNLNLHAEFAQIIPNNNPLGSAFIDDFENANKTRSLGLLYYTWTLASTPDNYNPTAPNGLPYQLSAEVLNDGIDPAISSYFLFSNSTSKDDIGFYWYNKKNEDKLTASDVYYDKTGSESEQKVNSIVFKLNPKNKALAFGNEDNNVNKEDTWGGVMKYLPSSYQDISEMKYIEFLGRVSGDEDVIINIDLGDLSEDIIPNSRMNSEDNLGKDWSSNNILDDEEGEDIGLDMLPGPLGFYSLSSVYDPEATKKDYEFYSFDNHPFANGRPKPDDDIDYYQYNKTEQNRRLDTEDLDRGGNLDTKISAYRYSFSFNSDEFLVKESNYKNGFKLYRIPLNKFKQILGNSAPLFEDVNYCKIWFNNVDNKDNGVDVDGSEIEFIHMRFVGNEWKAVSGYEDRIEVKTINTEDDENYKSDPPPFKLEKDDEGNIVKEQSLLVDFSLENYEKEAFVEKKLFEGENYLGYSTIKMYLHAGKGIGDNSYPLPSEKNLFFVFRFGKDSTNYYEYMSQLDRGWANNQMEITLDSLPILKNYRANAHCPVDSVYRKQFVSPTVNLKRYLGIRNNPSLSAIRYFRIGIIDSTDIGEVEYPFQNVHSEVWIDELRLTGIRNEVASAMKASASLNFADFANVSADITKREADFHSLTTKKGEGNNSLTFNLNSDMKLGNFFPKQWGISLPVFFTHTNSYAHSKYNPNSDILVNEKDIPDSVITRSKSYKYSSSFSKSQKSDSKILNYTLDAVSLNANISFLENSDPTYKEKESENYTYGLTYNLQFPQSWFSYEPFGWTKNIPVLNILQDEKINLLPNTYTTSFSTTQSFSRSISRSSKDNKVNKNYGFTNKRSIGTEFSPFRIANLAYSLNLSNDLYKIRVDTVTTGYDNTDSTFIVIVKDYSRDYYDYLHLDFGELSHLESNSAVDLKFKYTDWLSQSYNRSISYSWEGNLDRSTNGRTVDNSIANALSTKFKIGDLFKMLTKYFPPEEPKESPKEENSNSENPNKSENEQEEKRPFHLLTFLSENFRDIDFTFRKSRKNTASEIKSFEQAPLAFHLGFTDKPNLGPSNYHWNGEWGYELKSALSISKHFSINSLSFSFHRDYRENNTFEGSDAITSFMIPFQDGVEHKKVGIFDDNVFTLPNYSISITGLEELIQGTDIISSISLSHVESGSYGEKWHLEDYISQNANSNQVEYNFLGLPEIADRKVIDSKSYNLNYAPLVQLDVKFKNNLSFSTSYSYNFKMDESFNSDGEVTNGNKSYSKSYNLTGSYNQKGGFKLPFNFWPFNGKTIKNDLSYSLALTYTHNSSYKTKKDNLTSLIAYEAKNRGNQNSVFTISPKVTFKLSRDLTGDFNYAFRLAQDKKYGASSRFTSGHEFKLRMALKITGRSFKH